MAMQEISTSILPADRPDYLSVELTGIPGDAGQGDKQQIDLYLTLRFHEVWQNFMEGRFKFSIKGGELKLKLENCQMLQQSPQKSPSQANNENTKSIACHIRLGRSQTEPSWIFVFDRAVPSGSLKNFHLGTIQFNTFPCTIQAAFDISIPDIQLTDFEGLWRHDIHPNKHAVLERKLAISLVNSSLKPHLLDRPINLEYKSPETITISNNYEIEKLPTVPPEINTVIHQVIAAKTDNFIDLAKIAQLNPTEDFYGANLIGIDLAEKDLSGVNFSRVNLRGADLSDADLTEANLSNANLGGADLSGALLSDANLAGADLHKCSVALANLSGANLNKANLQEANLSNANLSDADLSDANFKDADLYRARLVLTNLAGTNLTDAKVEEARFRHDSGLSEELVRNLQQRGAIFEEPEICQKPIDY